MAYIPNLKSRDCDSNMSISTDTKDGFISFYGWVNCKYLTFKSHNDVINELNKEYPDLELIRCEKDFIIKNSHKEVLCYLSSEKDIFVFNNDDIAFTPNCFESK